MLLRVLQDPGGGVLRLRRRIGGLDQISQTLHRHPDYQTICHPTGGVAGLVEEVISRWWNFGYPEENEPKVGNCQLPPANVS